VERPRRSYLVVVDALHTEFADVAQVREALRKLFARERPGDADYALVAIGQSIQVIEDTTRDPAAVYAALEGKSFEKFILRGKVAARSLDMASYRRELDETLQVCMAPPPANRECTERKRMALADARSMADDERITTTGYLHLLRALIEQLAHAAQRRILVLASGGFSMTPGRAPLGLLSAYFPDMEMARLESVERMQDELEPVLRLAERANVPIDTIDARGLYTPSVFSASSDGAPAARIGDVTRELTAIQHEEGATLMELAEATGGTAYHGTNDLRAAFERAFAEGREYYLLAYTPSNAATDGKYRKIRVEVRAKGATVKSKRGYLADAEPQAKH
jgi:VWFA-related protein